MNKEEFIKQRCEIDKITEEEFEREMGSTEPLIEDEIERLKIIEEKYKDSQLYIHDFKEEIERLNNIINKVKQKLLNKKDIVEKSKYFKLVYYTDWNMKHEWDKRIVDKIDEIINIIDEENK